MNPAIAFLLLLGLTTCDERDTQCSIDLLFRCNYKASRGKYMLRNTQHVTSCAMSTAHTCRRLLVTFTTVLLSAPESFRPPKTMLDRLWRSGIVHVQRGLGWWRPGGARSGQSLLRLWLAEHLGSEAKLALFSRLVGREWYMTLEAVEYKRCKACSSQWSFKVIHPS